MQGYLQNKFKLSWREAGPPNHHDDKVDSDQYPSFSVVPALDRFERCRASVGHSKVKEWQRLSMSSLGGVPREQEMPKGHLPRIIHHQVY